MIEVKNISKIYRPKKGVPVKALDDVSLKFDDTGMVFILGKSGSGKSTLLNVLGGLDSYDSGEFVIQGKSSQDFTQSDFDSYRNTLIGFIFQEYNILNDFSVGANIALAMQLQGKKATNDALNKILDDVDLTGYANRKPNELSGGQKQRVAIARALIKEPRIIMADEPTGALDSNTGKQVFDTLKKLSKDKLVIIVSHDREFAEFYGDRVIELADGKIISDISKYLAPGVEKSEGVKVIDDKILHIKHGYKLTAKDLELINSYLEKSPVDTLISIDERANNSFKQIAMIDDSGNKQSFADTSTMQTMTAEEYDGENLKLIRSKLPYLHSLKMGASSLKHKKIRLFCTIILSMVAFALFGLADTFATYDKNVVAVNSIIDGNINSVVLEKQIKYRSGDESYYINAKANNSDIERVRKEAGVETKGVLQFGRTIKDYLNESPQKLPDYYSCIIAGITTFTDAEMAEYGFAVKGKMPIADNEIAITKWHYEHFAAYGYKSGSIEYESSELQDMDAFLDKGLTISCNFGSIYKTFTIVGIVDTGFNKDGKYDYLKQPNEKNINPWQFNNAIRVSIDATMFVSENIFNGDGRIIGRSLNDTGYTYTHEIRDENNILEYPYTKIAKMDEILGFALISNNTASLEENQVLISANSALDALDEIIEHESIMTLPEKYRSYKSISKEAYYDQETNTNKIKFCVVENTDIASISDFATLYQRKILRSHFLIQEDFIVTDDLIQLIGDLKNQIDMNDPEQVKLAVIYSLSFRNVLPNDLSEIDTKTVNHVVSAMFEMDALNKLGVKIVSKYHDNDKNIDIVKELEIVGYFIDSNKNNSSLIVSSDSLYDNTMGARAGVSGVYEFLVGKMPTNKENIANIVAFGYRGGDSVFRLRNSVSNTLESFNDTIEMLANMFIYIGIGFAGFAALMMMNFISTSISYKKREIGILRAVGASSNDVFGIFFNESAIIALINFVLATIATLGACIGLNSVIRNELGFPITLLSFGFRQIALIFAVSLLAAAIASFLPVMEIARKQPIDAIQNR